MFLFLTLFFATLLSFLYTYFLYDSESFTYWVFFLGIVISFFIVFILEVLIIWAFFIPVNKNKDVEKVKENRFYYFIVRQITYFLAQIFHVKMYVAGEEKLPKDGFLAVGNHQSNFDPIASVWIFKKQRFKFVAKDVLFKFPLLGKALVGSGFLPLNRSDVRQGIQVINASAERIKCGENIFIYPEGTRSKTRELIEFHAGSFKIAYKAKCPIAIIATDGAGDLGKRWPLATKTFFKVCEVLEYDDYKDMNTQELKDYVYKVLDENIKDMRARIPSLTKYLKKKD